MVMISAKITKRLQGVVLHIHGQMCIQMYGQYLNMVGTVKSTPTGHTLCHEQNKIVSKGEAEGNIRWIDYESSRTDSPLTNQYVSKSGLRKNNYIFSVN